MRFRVDNDLVFQSPAFGTLPNASVSEYGVPARDANKIHTSILSWMSTKKLDFLDPDI